MPRQRKVKDQPYEERLQRSLDRWPVENPHTAMQDPVTVGRLDEASDRRWLLRTHLTSTAARGLIDLADEMIIGDSGGPYTHVSASDRRLFWDSIETRGCLPDEVPSDHLTFEPYEFDSADGLTLLFVQRGC